MDLQNKYDEIDRKIERSMRWAECAQDDISTNLLKQLSDIHDLINQRTSHKGDFDKRNFEIAEAHLEAIIPEYILNEDDTSSIDEALLL